jgi:glycine dehydrogenase subunit 1
LHKLPELVDGRVLIEGQGGWRVYIPTTADERAQMLARIGVGSIDELFLSIPAHLRRSSPLALPPALTEMELTRHLGELSRRNLSSEDAVCFLGGGCYDHFIPAVVDTIAGRSEYYTSYTPYQPEVSQGTLQTSFEFQTMICELTGLDAANASLYESATASVEAVHLALAASTSKRVAVAESVHPEIRQTLATYLAPLDKTIVPVPMADGMIDGDAFQRVAADGLAAALIQSPNFFGIVEPVRDLARLTKEAGGLAIQVYDPISLGLFARPGDLGVDIAVAEGQGLGSPMAFGGPFLGLFACRQEHLRRMPGRVVGETLDRQGKRCFVLTLQTREQHIRREKATSNICSNQGLLALRSAVYLSLMGPEGMKEAAALCWHKAHYAARALAEIPGVRIRYPGTFFKEFVLSLGKPAEGAVRAMLDEGFHAGVALSRWDRSSPNDVLIAVTEKRTRAEIDAFVEAWRRVLA